MPSDKIMRFATTTSWQNVAVLIDADTYLRKYSKLWEDIFALQPSDGANPVRLAITDKDTSPASDSTSVLIDTNGRAFSEINWNDVWIKSPDGASVIELQGALAKG